MSTEERKAREKQRRYNRIVDAAEKVIFSKGIEQATMEEIAREAELSKGTLYLYFKSKNELYMAITRRGSGILNDRFARVFGGDHTGLELIRNIGEAYIDFVKDHPHYFKSFIHYESLSDVEELRESEIAGGCEENRRQALSFMVRALQIGMQDGSVDDRYDPRDLAMVLWSSTRGITTITHMKGVGHYFKVLDDMEIEVSTLFENFLNLLGTGIATDQARKKIMTDSQKNETSEK